MQPDVDVPGDGVARPTRAELRRQRDAADPTGGRADDAPAEAPAATAVPAGRAARRVQQQGSESDSALGQLLRTWWVYPLVALVVLFVVLGWRSTQTPQVPPGVHVTTPAPDAG